MCLRHSPLQRSYLKLDISVLTLLRQHSMHMFLFEAVASTVNIPSTIAQPIAMPSEAVKQDEPARVSGWGTTSEGRFPCVYIINLRSRESPKEA